MEQSNGNDCTLVKMRALSSLEYQPSWERNINIWISSSFALETIEEYPRILMNDPSHPELLDDEDPSASEKEGAGCCSQVFAPEGSSG